MSQKIIHATADIPLPQADEWNHKWFHRRLRKVESGGERAASGAASVTPVREASGLPCLQHRFSALIKSLDRLTVEGRIDRQVV
jgi:hypothetical protein